MPRQPTDDGALWAAPVPSARRRRLKTLLIAVAVTIVILVVMLQLEDYIDPHMTTNHAGAETVNTSLLTSLLALDKLC